MPGADLAPHVGWFTTIFPVRLDLAGVDLDDAFAAGPAAGAAVKAVKEQLLGDPGPRHRLRAAALPERRDGAGSLAAADAAGQLQLPRQAARRTATETDEAGWVPVAEPGLRRRKSGDMPVAAVVDINAMTVDAADGPQLAPLGVTRRRPRRRRGRANSPSCGSRRSTALAAYAEPGAGGFTPSDLDWSSLDQDAIDDSKPVPGR